MIMSPIISYIQAIDNYLILPDHRPKDDNNYDNKISHLL